jgi:integrase
VDLDAGTVFVHQSLQHTKREGLRFKSTKNEGSRLIRLPSGAVSESRRHKAEQAQSRLMLGEFWRDHGLVWPKDDGTPRNPDQASKTFHDFIRRTDLPPFRFHDLRHTHATLLGEAKVSSKVVQERLGHKTNKITTDLYTKVFSTAHKEAAEAMDRILRRA